MRTHLCIWRVCKPIVYVMCDVTYAKLKRKTKTKKKHWHTNFKRFTSVWFWVSKKTFAQKSWKVFLFPFFLTELYSLCFFFSSFSLYAVLFFFLSVIYCSYPPSGFKKSPLKIRRAIMRSWWHQIFAETSNCLMIDFFFYEKIKKKYSKDIEWDMHINK